MTPFFKLSPENIWMERQNKPSLVVRDITRRYPGVDPEFVYDVLLRRGVFKWLSVRRDIIKLKESWRAVIRELNRHKTQKEKGYLAAMERCRMQLRKLCHSNRWVSPDFDRDARAFLKKYS